MPKFVRFLLGVLFIIALVFLAPFAERWLLPEAMQVQINEKSIDASSLFYTESEVAGKVEFDMNRRN